MTSGSRRVLEENLRRRDSYPYWIVPDEAVLGRDARFGDFCSPRLRPWFTF